MFQFLPLDPKATDLSSAKSAQPLEYRRKRRRKIEQTPATRFGLLSKSLPLQQFHCDKGSSIELVNLVDGANVRMVQRRCSLGFPLEAAERLCVHSRVRREGTSVRHGDRA